MLQFDSDKAKKGALQRSQRYKGHIHITLDCNTAYVRLRAARTTSQSGHPLDQLGHNSVALELG